MSKQFTLASGVEGGSGARYFFSPNPSEYEIPTPSLNSARSLEGQNVRQRPWDESLIYRLHWANAPITTYNNLKAFSARNANNNLVTVFFYDGDIGEFPVRNQNVSPAVLSGTAVKVLDVIGVPIVGGFDIDLVNNIATHRYEITMLVERAF